MPLVVDWWLFTPAVLLLLFPGDRLMSPQVELLNFDRASHRSRSPKCSRWVYSRWLEPLRSFGGAFVLKVSLPLTTDLWHYVPQTEYSLFVGVLFLGMILQLFTRREEDALLAPIGYVVGLMFAIVPWPVALVGLIAGITSLFAFRQLQGFFGMAAVVVVAIGLLLEAPVIWMLPIVGVLLVPVIAGLTTGRTLEMPVPRDPEN